MARVYFAESDTDFWWKRMFLHDQFSHVFIVVDGVLLNPAWHQLQVDGNASDEYECTTYIDVTFEEADHKMRPLFQMVTCTSLIKDVLGIRNWCIITPYQLFQYLQRHHDG